MAFPISNLRLGTIFSLADVSARALRTRSLIHGVLGRENQINMHPCPIAISSYCLIADVFNKLPVEFADPTADRDKVLPLLKNQCQWDFLSHSLQATIREQNQSL